MSVGLTVTTQRVWAGQVIKPRPLIWIAGEGQDDIVPIYEAWMKDHPGAVRAPGSFWFEQAVDFGSRTKTKEFITLLEERKTPPALFILDALGDTNEISNLDEDKSRDMYRVYANIWRVIRTKGGGPKSVFGRFRNTPSQKFCVIFKGSYFLIWLSKKHA
jgi:hypothetical protein